MYIFKLLSIAAIAAAVRALSAVVDNVERRNMNARRSENVSIESVVNSTALYIGSDTIHASTCTDCEAILTLLKGVAAVGDTFFIDVMSEICILSGVGDEETCSGSFALEGPSIAYDLRKIRIGSTTSQLLCTNLLGLCPYPNVNPYVIIHYSDIHIDPFYVTGSNTNCTKIICCRNYTTVDLPGNNDSPAGPHGDHRCDTPTILEESMYTAIETMFPNAVFSLFTGDIVDHAIWNTTQAQNIININDAYKRMATHGLTVYGTAGNHEASPADLFPPNEISDGAQWVYDTLAADWTQWIGAEGGADTKDFGAYSVKYPGGNLRIISINTNMYYIQNFMLYEEPMERDPSGQLAWLVSELDAAEKASERVYIVGHMPMGDADALRDGSNYFDQIVNRYDATIAALCFGHTHRDHFEISYADYGARSASGASAISYIMPSLTPTSGMPAFRVYEVDPVTFAVLDSTTYIADMTNLAYQSTGPVWTKYYSATEAYVPLVTPPLTNGTAELTPAFWHNVTEVLAAEPAAFADYYARRSRGWNVTACTGDCATEEICRLRSARSQDNCATPQPGPGFSKRSETTNAQHAHHDECGMSISRSTLGSLVKDKVMLKILKRRAIIRKL